eukprot:TRINITY_DN5455_c1_g1_i1.p2 TRINITY_DN5455_c1_g1~~TRINITY_DN5455_c1_g1_i1.p2  ORF type:complete len:100 (-),score=17.15 TRINITY_DN5455_c1_g1_i1:58-357(-)
MLDTFDKAEILEIAFKDEQRYKKPLPISVTFVKDDTSINSNAVQFLTKCPPMLVTFAKPETLETVFKDKHSSKNPCLISVTFENGDKSTDSKEEHPLKK